MHSDYGQDSRVLLNGVIYTLSPYLLEMTQEKYLLEMIQEKKAIDVH